MSHTVEEIDALLRNGGAKRLGMGTRRACYALPGGSFCVKCYRSDEEIEEGKHPERRRSKPVARSVAREIRSCRFDEEANTCCQEYRYWSELKCVLPARLMSVFPSSMELVRSPSRGWCVVEELVANGDGSPVVKFHEAWMSADAVTRERLLKAFDSLVEDLVRYAVRIYDPQNILVQNAADGSMCLRITDFEPASRALIPFDHLAPAVVRMKIRRRIGRYRRQFRIYGDDGAPPAASSSLAEPVNILCVKWDACYSSRYVNRLYAGVRRNLRRRFRFVCVADDASGFAPGIEAVPFPSGSPRVGMSSRGFDEVARLVAMAEMEAGLSGPTLFLDVDVLVTGPLDRFFDYDPGQLCVVNEWAKARKGSSGVGAPFCFRYDAGRQSVGCGMPALDRCVRSRVDGDGDRRLRRDSPATAGPRHARMWPEKWVCSFSRRLVPAFPLNKMIAPRRPPEGASIVAFHGEPEISQALEGCRALRGKSSVRLACRPARWILEYWHE